MALSQNAPGENVADLGTGRCRLCILNSGILGSEQQNHPKEISKMMHKVWILNNLIHPYHLTITGHTDHT